MAKKGRKVKVKKEFKPKKQKAVKKEEPKKKLVIDLKEDIGLQIVDYWQNKEPDTIMDVYGTPEHSLGVSKVIYSRLPTLDKILAVKRDTDVCGIPLKMIEIFGPESCGKTSFMYYLACLFASNGGVAHFIDFEHRYDPTWLSTIAHNTFGLTEEQLKRIQPIKPPHYEWFSEWIIKHMKTIIVAKDKAYNEIKELEKKKPKDYEEKIKGYQKVMDMPFVVLVDSVANMYTKKEIEDEDETEAHVALLSRGLSEKLKLMRRYLAYANILIVWVNQERDDIAAARFAKGRRMLTTPGGKAIKYNCDARIRMSFVNTLNRTRNNIPFKIGNITQFKVVKNLFGPPPFQTVNLKFLYDRGFFTFHSILEACVEAQIIKKVGARYRINGGKVFGEIEMEEASIDEAQLKYPGLEDVLHRVYRKRMGEILV